MRVEGKLDAVQAEQARANALADQRAQDQARDLASIKAEQEAARLAEEARLLEVREMEERRRLELAEEAAKAEIARQELVRQQLAQAEAIAANAAEAQRLAAEQRDQALAQQGQLDALLVTQEQMLLELKRLRAQPTAGDHDETLASLERKLHAGDAAIQQQLAGGADQVGGIRGVYILARAKVREGKTEEALELYARFTSECADEYDPLAEYMRFLSDSAGAEKAAAEMRRLYDQRGLLCAGLMAALAAPPSERLKSLQSLQSRHPEFELVTLFLGRQLLTLAQSSADGLTYAKAAQELRRASAAIRARGFDAYVLDRGQIHSWLEEIERTLPLISAWEAQQVVAAKPPPTDDCYFEVLKVMRSRGQISEVGKCAGDEFILYRIFQSAAEAADPNGALRAAEAGKKSIAEWLEVSIATSQKSSSNQSSGSGRSTTHESSFTSSSISTSDVTQSGVQLYASQVTADGGLEYVFLLSSSATRSVRAMREAIRTPNKDGLVCVEARAIVSMLGKNAAQARDAALAAAKQDALSQVVGFRQRTIFAQMEGEADQQRSLSLNKGYIKSMSIEMDIQKSDVYVVEIVACISVAEIDKNIGDVMKSMGNPQIAIDSDASVIRTYLEAELGRAQVRTTRHNESADFIIRIRPEFEEYTRTLGARDRAATRMNAELLMSDRDTLEMVCQRRLPEIRSFLADKGERERDCQRQVLQAPVAGADEGDPHSEDQLPSDPALAHAQLQEFLACVRDSLRRLADEGRPLLVTLGYSSESRSQVQQLLQGLRQLPGTTSIQSEIYSDSQATVELRFLGSSQWLAEILERDFKNIESDTQKSIVREEITPRSVRLNVQ
jgi:hypothetical protein